MRTVARNLVNGILQLAYPATCLFCQRLIPPGESSVCTSCESDLNARNCGACPRCGATAGPFAELQAGCPLCHKITFHFSEVARLGAYEGHLREAILRLKRPNGDLLALALGKYWAARCRKQLLELQAELIIPVPLHWWRRWRRGHDQSEGLARPLAQALGLACQPGWLRRVRNTPRQVEQTPTQRRNNVHGAFDARPRPMLRGKTVLLVDDVITTGSTASEAAAALKRAGAKRIVVAVLAGAHAR